MLQSIAIDQVRVGMFVHLDGGWLSHPFPLSNFCITTEKELVTLRGLGLRQVSWAPDKSQRLPDGRFDEDAGGVSGNDADLDAASAQPAALPVLPVSPAKADPLVAQRASFQASERQYAHAAQAWRQASDSLALRPQDCQRHSEALAATLLDKLLAAEDVAIRLVHGGGNDRAAAHALNVAILALLMGRVLGLSDADMLDLGVGALLHDIGKLDMADRVRHAEDAHSGAEVGAYRDHVAKGLLQGQRMGLSAGALAVLAQHHELVDGSGFPARLRGDSLSTAARIVAIVNRYDNLCNPGARVPALTPHEAVSTLFAQSRSRLDSPVLGAFIRMMGVYPAGSLVQLTDDRWALVVAANSSRPLKPQVLVCDSRTPRSEALLLNLQSVADLGIRRSVSAAKLPPQALQYLDPRPRVAYYFDALAPPALGVANFGAANVDTANAG